MTASFSRPFRVTLPEVQRRSSHDWVVPLVRYRTGDGYVDTTHNSEE